MELRQYGRIIRRRAWIPLLLVAVVGVVSLLTKKTLPPLYTASLRFTVGVKAQGGVRPINEETYYAWIASEYLADDLSVIVSSQAFAADVNRHLQEMGSAVQIAPGSISGVTFAEKQHRILQMNLTWGKPDELADIGRATVTTLQEDGPKYFAQLSTPAAFINSVIDEPLPPAVIPPSLTQRLDLPVRLILALLAGVGLVFLLNYLDTSVREATELESMGIPVLAEIPKQK